MAKQLKRDMTRALPGKAASRPKRFNRSNAWLLERSLEKSRQLEALASISKEITRLRERDKLLALIIEEAGRLLHAEGVGIRLLDGDDLRLVARNETAGRTMIRSTIKVGESLSGRVVTEGKPVAIYDLAGDPRHIPEHNRAAVAAGLRSFLGVPLRLRDEIIGVMNVYTKKRRRFSQGEIDLACAIADHAAIAVENARLFEETQRSLERIKVLGEIDQAITSTLDLDAVLNILLQKIDLVLLYSATTVRLFNKQSGLLEPVACRNLDEKEWKAEQWRGGRGIPNVVFETRAPVRINNVQTDPRNKDPNFFRKHGLVSYLGVPLIVKDEVLGVISFYTKEEHEFSDEEVEFLTTLAGQAAIAIHNSQLYQEMVSLAAQLSRSNKVKDEFLSVMSHELRTPLNVVMGYTGMIRDGLLGEINAEQEKALDKVISRARDQLTMISSLLQVTQLEAAGGRVERREVGLQDLLDDLKSSYAIPLGKELSLIWDWPLDLPVIHTDGEKLKHILQNLVNNAIKFTDSGTVTISTRYLDGASTRETGTRNPKDNGRNGLVQFKVADTGVGIAKDHFSLIFERFQQVDSSETRLHGGVGIGLYIVRKFTEMLGGKIDVESEVGKGSTFTVTIPCE